MSISGIAAAATVYDTIGDVAWDASVSVGKAIAVINRFNLATVFPDGAVTMDEKQSRRTAAVLHYALAAEGELA